MRAGWQLKTLGEICSFENGDRGENYPSKSVQTTSGIPFINAGHLTDFGIDHGAMNYIPKERFDLLGNGKIRKGDILFCLRGSLGKFASVGELSEGAIASSLVIVRPKESVLNKYVLAYFQSNLCSGMINKFKNGAAQPNLSAGSLKKFIIPIPPLPEQKRIVAILDEAFAGIATAVANTEKNLGNARELFEGYLNNVFTQKGEGWVENRLEEIGGQVSTGPFGSLLHKSDYVPNGTPLVNPANIVGASIVPNLEKTVNQDALSRLSAYVLHANDIVIGRRGEIGRCTVVAEEQDGWLCGTGSFFIRLSENIIPDFLAHLLRSPKYRNRLEELATGATMMNLSNKALSNLIISVPDITTQRNILDSLDSLATETNRLESLYQHKLTTLAELKQSLLHKAFSGALTSQSVSALQEAVA